QEGLALGAGPLGARRDFRHHRLRRRVPHVRAGEQGESKNERGTAIDRGHGILQEADSQPLTAPAVRPETKKRCRSTKVAITGTRPMKLAAATSCHSVSYPLWKLKRPTGIVKCPWESRSTRASANSAQYQARLKVAVAPRPGPRRGRATRQRTRGRDAPSRRAASSSDVGSASKKFLSTTIVNGSCTAA